MANGRTCMRVDVSNLEWSIDNPGRGDCSALYMVSSGMLYSVLKAITCRRVGGGNGNRI